MITDNPNFWNEKGKQANWQEYILPGRTTQDFDKEGKAQADAILNFIEPRSVIIDYGCGIGRVAKHLAFNSKKTIGIDISESYIAKAKQHCEAIDNLEFFTLKEFKDKTNVADFIYSLMVLQHNSANNRQLIIEQIHQLLKRGGTTLISFPMESSKIYTETKFVHKFTYTEVQEYALQFRWHRIFKSNLIYYKGHVLDKIPNEYFLLAKK